MGKFKNIFLDGVRITFIWFTVQEGQVIDGDVPSKIIPNCTFNQNLPNRKKSTFTVTDEDFKFLSERQLYLERLGAGQVKRLPVPHVSLIPISYPQHGPAACRRGPEVYCQAEHVRSKHVVMEAENAVG